MSDKLRPKEKIELGIYIASLARSVWMYFKKRKEQRKLKSETNENEKDT